MLFLLVGILAVIVLLVYTAWQMRGGRRPPRPERSRQPWE